MNDIILISNTRYGP